MRRGRVGFLVALATVSLAASRAGAANLIGNGTFDDAGSYLTGWVNVGSNESWAADDADGTPDSGSVEIANTGNDDSTEFVYACVPIQGAASYQYGARHEILSGQMASGEARVVLFFDSDAHCLVDIFAVQTTSNAIGAWTSMQSEALSPPNAVAAHLLLLVYKMSGDTANDLRIRFDDAFLVAEPSAGALQLAALGALAAFGSCRRGSA